MDDVERDSRITVNIGFGNITFHKGDNGGCARAIVDIGLAPEGALGPLDQIEIAFTIPASPDSDTISEIVERSRRHIATLLRTAAAYFDNETAESLLYPEEPRAP